MPKLVKNNAGQLTEEATIATSAGAASAGRVPELGAAGKLSGTMIDSTVTSAGAGDAGRAVALDGSGRIDTTVLPVGIGADTAVITASEALSAGDYVNLWSNAGTANVRKADASGPGKDAMGFVLAAVASGAPATVYFEGSNTAASVKTPGYIYLDASNPGKGTATAPTTSGQVVQVIGFGTGSAVNFQFNRSLQLA